MLSCAMKQAAARALNGAQTQGDESAGKKAIFPVIECPSCAESLGQWT